MPMSSWKSQWADLQQLLTDAGFTARWAEGATKPPRFEIDPPATKAQVQKIESQLNAPIPDSLRRVLLEFSSRVCIEWSLPGQTRAPGQLKPLWAGECRWDLSALPELRKTHREWIEKCFSSKSSAYDLVWHHKFAFLEVRNGDMVAIDIAPASSQPVVYLSHEDGPCHGFRLGQNFEDYVDRLTALALVGAEDVQQEVFLPDATGGLKTQGNVFTAWRKWLTDTAKRQ